MQQADRTESTGVDLVTTMNAISLFCLLGGEQVFSINQESLQSCVSQSLYIGTIEFASATMSGIISDLARYNARIADADSLLSQQDERLNGVIELLESLYREGFITESDARSIDRVIFRIDAIYGNVEKKLEEASNLIAAQIPLVDERKRLADLTLAQFRQSGIPCYHVLLGRWDQVDPPFHTPVYHCIRQDRFRITITTYRFDHIQGQFRTRSPWQGETENNRLTILYDNNPPARLDYEIFDGSTSRARMCRPTTAGPECFRFAGSC